MSKQARRPVDERDSRDSAGEVRDGVVYDAPLTLTEAAAIMGVSIRTIGRYIADGWLGAVRMPNGRFRVKRSAVMAIVEVRQLAEAHRTGKDG